jgi:hypothetical protein
MDAMESLPAGWETWSEEPEGRVVLAYRPDVFDSEAFDPACLPTLTVAPGRSPDRPPTRRGQSDGWHAVLYLEPRVRVRDCDASFADRASAIEGAHGIASRFAGGEIDYRGAYQRPREAYLDRLDELTGES